MTHSKAVTYEADTVQYGGVDNIQIVRKEVAVE